MQLCRLRLRRHGLIMRAGSSAPSLMQRRDRSWHSRRWLVAVGSLVNSFRIASSLSSQPVQRLWTSLIYGNSFGAQLPLQRYLLYWNCFIAPVSRQLSGNSYLATAVWQQLSCRTFSARPLCWTIIARPLLLEVSHRSFFARFSSRRIALARPIFRRACLSQGIPHRAYLSRSLPLAGSSSLAAASWRPSHGAGPTRGK